MKLLRLAHLLTPSLTALALVVACGGDNAEDASTSGTPTVTTTSGSGGSTVGATGVGGTATIATSDTSGTDGSTSTSDTTTSTTSTTSTSSTGGAPSTTESSTSSPGDTSGMTANTTGMVATTTGMAAGGTGMTDDGTTMAAGGTSAQSMDTWTSFAQGFFQDYCVSCHNEDMMGDATRDQTQLSAVMAEAAAIACGVATQEIRATLDCAPGDPAANQFPAGNGASPSDEERARLVAWIEAGMPE